VMAALAEQAKRARSGGVAGDGADPQPRLRPRRVPLLGPEARE